MQISLPKLGAIVGGSVIAGTLLGASAVFVLKSRSSNYSLDSQWPFCFKSCNSAVPFPGNIYVVTSYADLESILPRFESDLKQIKLLGFDCEWSTINKRSGPVSLLQLATTSGLCILVRLCLYEDSLPKCLLEVLANKDILKVGVGAYDDSCKLLADHGIVVNGCVDLRDLSIRDRQYKYLSLKGLAFTYLNIKMEKLKSIQCSNWDSETLTEKQIMYAANDAWMAVRVFSSMVSKKMEKHSSNLRGNIGEAVAEALWDLACSYSQGLKDEKFRNTKNGKKMKKTASQPRSTSVFKPLKLHSTRKQPLYDNCKLEAPDGQLLSTCDKKKADWYVTKELADVVCDDPHTIRLRFEPASRPSSDRDYYLFNKENVCVVCGSGKSIVRKNVIPHEYRKHLPLILKDHVSHDILPLCAKCHQLAGYHDYCLRRKIAEEYDAPVGSIQTIQLLEDPTRRSIRSAGHALATNGIKIPQPRKDELERVIKKYYNVEELTDDLIHEASKLETRYRNEAYIRHGEKVVKTIYDKEELQGLVNFEKRWRVHFLSTMQPKHLPYLWSVEHNHDRLQERDLLDDEKFTK
ncbi:exonuclease 3'-5' domain-containing protein 2-like [Clavelina lepadiformis]|uniref:exonuclease 3'-5' domain-containing protein 2-like n=1 Tax=Clavelina lepadiformis TaxID=159417 RepID=UPI0040418EAB